MSSNVSTTPDLAVLREPFTLTRGAESVTFEVGAAILDQTDIRDLLAAGAPVRCFREVA